MSTTQQRFPLGQTYATPGALEALSEAGQDAAQFLCRHQAGDWGDVDNHDRQANDRALTEGTRLFSVYHSEKGPKFWVITEADRSATTILLPDEY